MGATWLGVAAASASAIAAIGSFATAIKSWKTATRAMQQAENAERRAMLRELTSAAARIRVAAEKGIQHAMMSTLFYHAIYAEHEKDDREALISTLTARRDELRSLRDGVATMEKGFQALRNASADDIAAKLSEVTTSLIDANAISDALANDREAAEVTFQEKYSALRG